MCNRFRRIFESYENSYVFVANMSRLGLGVDAAGLS